MAWKCPNCGVEHLAKPSNKCPSCDHKIIPEGVTLKSNTSGKQMTFQFSLALGVATLKNLDDPGLRYVSERQFKLEKNKETACWIIFSELTARNPTFLNGNAIPLEGHALQDGDIVSIKDKHFHLTVSIA